MLDRILLVLLLTLLPLGVFVVSTKIKTQSTPVSDATVKKFEAVIEQMQKQQANNNGNTKSNANFNVTGVVYDKNRQVLTVAGMGPSPTGMVWCWYSAEEIKSTTNNKLVNLKTNPSPSPMVKIADKPKIVVRGPVVVDAPGGGFSLEIDVANMNKIVEILLKQNGSESVLRFDLDNNKQL